MGKNLVIILAGGAGERLLLLSEHRAKPAVPFCGTYRIIDFALSNCANSGLHDIFVLSQYRPHSLTRHIGTGRAWNLDRDDSGVVILQPHVSMGSSRWYSGNADAVFQNLHFIEERGPENVLILGGDHVYAMDYRPLLRYHKDKDAELTVCVKRVRQDDTHKFGTCVVDGRGLLVDFTEKAPNAASNLASMGVYVFRTDLLSECLERDARNAGSTHDFGKDIIPLLAKSRGAFAYEFDGYWEDVGTINTYYEANMVMLSSSPPINLDDDSWRVRSNYGDVSPAMISHSASISQSMIGEGSEISGRVEYSIISPQVTVEEGAAVRDSIVLPGCRIGRNAKVNLAILDKHCTVGENAKIGYGVDFTPNEAYPSVMKSGITLVGRGISIPADATIGRNCLVGSHESGDLMDIPSGRAVL